MNTFERFDRDVVDVITELAQPHFPDYFDEVLERAVADRQRPAWTFPERWFPMSVLTRRLPFVPALSTRAIGLVLMLLLLLAATVVIGVGALRPQEPVAPPFGLAANGLIAYSVDGDIYSTDPRSGETRLIVGGPTDDFGPVFSSDGTRVFFIRRSQLEPQEVIAVMIADANGANPRTLVDPEVSGPLHWWMPSPDGRHLAVTNSAFGVPPMSVVDVATGARTPIDVPIHFREFEWLPDSSEILFHGRGDAQAIYAVHPDGTDFRRVTDPIPGIVESTRLRVSHDGRYIGYSSRVGGSGTIYLFDVHSGETRSIAPPSGGHVSYPVFSTDSRSVAYVRYDEAASTAQMVVAPLASAPEGAVDVGPPMPVGDFGHSPQFSPDSTSLLITSEAGDVWLADMQSRTYEPLELSKDELDLSWQRRAP